MRTEYAGRVDEKFIGQTVTLFGWVHRRRDHGGVIFIDLRDREGLVQVVCDPDRADVFANAEKVRNEYLPEGHRPGAQAPGRHDQRERSCPAASRCCAHELEILNASVPVPFQLDDENLSETTRLTHRVLDLRRAADAEEPDAALQGGDGRAASYLDAHGLRRHRDADADQEHAGRRARLPGAVARAPRRVLRAAAVAAALQAAADGRGLRPLLPDRQVLPRRGPARRPPARVHADRRRDVVPRRDRDPRDHGRDDPHRLCRGDERHAAEAVPGDDRMATRCGFTAPTSRTCASHCN